MAVTDNGGVSEGFRLLDEIPGEAAAAKAIAHKYGIWMRRLDGEEWEDAASRFFTWIERGEEAGVLQVDEWWALFQFAANRRPRLLSYIDELFPHRPSTASEFVALKPIDGGRANEQRKPDTKGKPDFRAFWDGDELPKPTPTLIKGVLPLDGVTVLGGRSGAGKSYLAVHLTVCLAAQIPFFGHKVRHQCNVLYIAAEGGPNMVPRLAAAKQAAGIADRLPIKVIRRASFPSDEATFATYLEHVAAEVAEMRERTGIKHAFIPIDTVSAAFEVGDENDAAKVTALCKRARAIAEKCAAHVFLVHHFGKDEDRLFRGSSAWRDNVDHAFSIFTERANKTAETTARNLNIEKSRLGPEGKLTGYTLINVEIGEDEDGDAWTEAAIEQAKYKPISNKDETARKESRGGKVLADAFAETMLSHGEEHRISIGGAGVRQVRAVRLLTLRDEFIRRYPSDNPKTAQKAWERELKGIGQYGLGYASETDKRGVSWLWRPDMQQDAAAGDLMPPASGAA